MMSFKKYLIEAHYDLGLTDLAGMNVSKMRFMKSAIRSFDTKGDFAKLEEKVSRLLGKKYIKKITPDEYTAALKSKNYLHTDYERRNVWSYNPTNKQLQVPHDFNSKDVLDVATMLHELGHRMFAHGGSEGTDEDWLADEKLSSNFALEVLKLAGIDTASIQQQFEKDYNTYIKKIKSRLACWACGSGNTRDMGSGTRSCQDCYTDY
jgi:hypothetical protein